MAKKNTKSAAQKHEAAVQNIINHFATTYISSGDDRLSAFQDLCKDLDVEVGASLTQCKKVTSSQSDRSNVTQTNHIYQNIKSVKVNIYDFVRVKQMGGDVSSIKYRGYRALRQDMVDNPKRRFPLHRAKADELLEVMLVTL
jgi:hypothetical protein